MKKKLHFLWALLVAMLLIPGQLDAQFWSENFDNLTSGVPTGWVVEGNATHPWKSTVEYSGYTTLPKYNNSHGLHFYSYSSSTGQKSILKTPVFSLVGLKPAQLSFYYAMRDKYSSNQGTMYVIISKDGGNTYNDTILRVESDVESYTLAEFSLANYANESNLCVIFSSTSGYGYYHCLDNIEVAPLPTCAKAIELSTSEVYQNDATLSWKLETGKGAAANNYKINVYAVGNDETPFYTPESVDFTLDATTGVYSYTIEGELDAGTGYYFTVQGICGKDDQAAIARSEVFYTQCVPYALPIALDTVTEEGLKPCWTMTDADYLSNRVYLNSSNTVFASPVLNHAANDIEVTIRYAGTSTGTGFYYGLASDASCSDFDTLGYVAHTATYSERKISVNTAGTKFGNVTGKIFAIRPDAYMYVYGINVHAKPCCPRVEQVKGAAIDSASIELSWLGSAASYNITLVDTATSTTINRTVSTNPATISALAPQTSYLVLVQAVCADTCVSAWSDSIYVSTLCGVGNALFNENFEYEELGSVMPECWVQSKKDAWIVNHNIGYYETPNNAANGYSAIYMYYYGVEHGKTATFSPQPFKVETAGQYDVKFAMYRYSKQNTSVAGDGSLTVWANNRPDTVGATKVCEIDRYYEFAPAEKSAGWYYYEYNIPAVTGTVYLVFEGKSNTINNLYLDDITVKPAATCRKVRNVEIDEANITINSLPLKWEAAEGTSQWKVDYALIVGTDTVTNTSVVATSNPFVITGLNPSTAYKIKGTVSTLCGEDNLAEAIPFEYSFQTRCLAVTTFPYFEGFENSWPPICWDMKNTAGNTDFVWKQYDYSTYVYEGTYAAYWSYKSSGSKAILVTPEFTFADDTDYRIEFFAFRGTSGSSYAGEGFGVYLSETPTVTEESELLAFIPRLTSESSDKGIILSVPTVSAQGMYQYKIDFNTADYTGKYIIFEAVTNNGYYQSIDNVWIGEKPAIDIITKFNVDSVVIDAARITIPDETVAMFDLVYGAKGFDPATAGTLVDSIEGRVCSITGLDPFTEYDVYVRARNAIGQVSAWSRTPMSFRTLCAAFVVNADNAFVEDFESVVTNSNDFVCMVQSYPSSYYFSAKEKVDYYDDVNYGWADIYPASGSKLAYCSSTSGDGTWLFRAVQLEAGQNYSLSVSALETSSYDVGKIAFGYATTPDRSAVTKFLSGYVVPEYGPWERVAGYFTVPTSGVYYVGVGVEKGSSNVSIDSLVIRTESIIPPTVDITNLTDSSVSFSLASNAFSWQMYYATSKFNPDTINPSLYIDVEELTHIITGLAANTTYYYAFRSFPEEGDPSSWTSVGSFKTECSATTLPLEQGFETDVLDCWTVTGAGSILRRSYNKQSGSYSWSVSDDKKLISPRINGDLSNCEGSFWAAAAYSGSRYAPVFAIGVMTNPQDPTTLKVVDTITVDYVVTDGKLQEYTFSLESLKEDPVYKNAKYFVFEQVQGSSYLDALVVSTLPTCRKPDSLSVTAVTASTITLDWKAGKTNETSWSILVKQGNDTVKTLVVNSHPYVVTGLASNSVYNFELRALCAANDSSKVVELRNITTACDVYTIPYANALNGIPACWTVEDNNSSDYWSWKAGSGLTQLSTDMADSYACDTARLFSPEFNISSKALLSIDMYTYYTAGTFNILFDNGTTRDTIVANYQHHNAWDTVQYDLTAYKGQTGRFVFEGYGPKQSAWAAYWYLRNFEIIEVIEAPAPAAVQYGGGYFTSDMLQVELTTTETRPNYILVTLDGSEPSFEGVAAGTTSYCPSGQKLPLTESKVVKLRTILFTAEGAPYQTAEGAYLYSDVVTATFTKVALPATPVFTPAAGNYYDSVTVSIACATPGALIKYEFGGSEPTGRSATYTAPFQLKTTTAVAAMAFLTDTVGAPLMTVEGLPIASLVARADYNVTPYVAPAAPALPTIQYGGGYFTNDMLPVAVTTTETRPNYILVTIDGSEPSFEGVMAGKTNPVASGQQIQLTDSKVIKARGMLMTESGQPYQNPDGTYVYSEVATATFTKVEAPKAPVFTPAAGDYYDSVVVSIACATANTMIKYELGGTEPTGRSATYATPFKLTNATVVSAMAFLTDAQGAPIMNVEGMPIASAVARAEYKVAPYVAPTAPALPTIQYGGGYFTNDMLPVAVTTTETRPNYILVTIDGSEPSFEGVMAGTTNPVASGQQIQLTDSKVIKARGMLMTESGQPYQTPAGAYIYSDVVTATFTKATAPVAPEFTPAAGEYTDSVVVSIACATANTIIKYELGGAEPTGRSATYTTPFKLTASTVVSAMAFLTDAQGAPIMDVEGMPIASAAVRAEYKVKETLVVANPVFTPAAGEYLDKETLNVTLTCATADAKIYWTYGTDASVNHYSFEYEREIPVDAKNNTISAIAIVFDDNAKVIAKSEVVYATYTLKAKEDKPIEIRFTPAAGEYKDSIDVTIEYLNVPEGGMCVYSVDGTAPMREYKSTTRIHITETTTVKARVLISMSPSFQFSETVEAVYTIVKSAPEYEAPAAPVFSPEAGEYKDSVAVTLTCETENAIILYDVLGLTPNFTSPRFEGEPIMLKETTTIAALAVLVDAEGEVILDADDMPYMSELVTATYVITPSQGVGVDNIELAAIVYAKGGMIYVDTQLGNMIEVFTVQGQLIYSAEATAELTAIDAFNADVLLVRVNGQTIKVAIK